MERTPFLEFCQTEKLRYDLCLKIKLFDYHCVLDKYGWTKCEKKKEDYKARIIKIDSKNELSKV